MMLLLSYLLMLIPFAEASDGEKRLHNYLFANYNTYVRPRHDPHQTVVIDLELNLKHLIKLDEHTEVLTASVAIGTSWDDDYLIWNPDDYDDVKRLTLAPWQIWHPDLGIDNSVENFFMDDLDRFYAKLLNTGRVHWWTAGVTQTSCHVDGTHFPFDWQECDVVIKSWAFSRQFVDLQNASNSVRLDGFRDDPIWRLLATRVENHDLIYETDKNEVFAEIHYKLHFERKPEYYVLNIICPCCLLVIVSLLVYCVPPDADRLSLSVTVLLAFSVFQFVVNDLTPASSDTTPVVGLFVLVTMSLSAVSVIMSIFSVRVNSITSPLPSWVRAVAFGIVARLMRVSVPDRPEPTAVLDDGDPATANSAAARVVYVPADRTSTLRSVASLPPYKRPHLSVNSTPEHAAADFSNCGRSTQADCCSRCQLKTPVEKLLQELRKITNRQRSREAEEEMAEEWRTMAIILDRLLFWITVIILVVSPSG